MFDNAVSMIQDTSKKHAPWIPLEVACYRCHGHVKGFILSCNKCAGTNRNLIPTAEVIRTKRAVQRWRSAV